MSGKGLTSCSRQSLIADGSEDKVPSTLLIVSTLGDDSSTSPVFPSPWHMRTSSPSVWCIYQTEGLGLPFPMALVDWTFLYGREQCWIEFKLITHMVLEANCPFFGRIRKQESLHRISSESDTAICIPHLVTLDKMK
jgi:hypothetical protein